MKCLWSTNRVDALTGSDKSRKTLRRITPRWGRVADVLWNECRMVLGEDEAWRWNCYGLDASCPAGTRRSPSAE